MRLLNLRASVNEKILQKEWNDKLQSGYLLYVQPTDGWYFKYIKNVYIVIR